MKRVLLLVALVFAGVAPADTIAHRFVEAQQAYDANQPSKAVALYQELVREGVRDAALWYNLGNATFRDGDPARALLHYRRALWEDPADGDLQENIQHALRETGAAFPPLPWPRRITGFWNHSTWWCALTVLVWLFALLRIAAHWRQALRPLAAWGTPLVLLAAALALFGLWASRPSLAAAEAVVLVPTATVRFEPHPEATARFSVPGGSVVRVLERAGTWMRVQSGSERGWLESGALETLTP